MSLSSPESQPAETSLYESGVTIRSDSENYEANNELSSSPAEYSDSPVILYQPPTFWGLIRGAVINLFLPFVNGLMLGFGELLAHEVAFRWGWSGTKVRRVHFMNILADAVIFAVFWRYRRIRSHAPFPRNYCLDTKIARLRFSHVYILTLPSGISDAQKRRENCRARH